MAITIDSKSPVCLDEFRAWGNFDPLTFNQLDWAGCTNSPVDTPPCLWWVQHLINDPIMNRELLARHLCECAEELRTYLGTYVVPTWTSETIKFPDYWMSDNPWVQPWAFENYQLQTNCWGLKEFGQPLYTLISTETITYTDSNSDGIKEIAEFTFILPAGVTLDQIKLYFTGRENSPNSPDQHYEICPIKNMVLDTATSVVTVTLDSWNLINPDLYAQHSWLRAGPISACDDANYVLDLEVWSETVDACKPQIEVVWNSSNCEDCGGMGCTNCQTITKFACARYTDLCEGIYNFSLIGTDSFGCPDPTENCVDAPCRRPDYIRVYYRAGAEDKSTKRALFLMAASKYLMASNCECDCVKNVLGTYSQSLINRNEDGKTPWTNISFSDMSELPFAPTLGSMLAYKILKEVKENRCSW